ncbi:MAG: TolC family protein [Gammaproteobacteria bacterium]
MLCRSVHAALAACLLSSSAMVLGADDSSLSLRDAIERAGSARPELAGFVLERRVREAETRAARLRPLPRIELAVEDALGSDTRSGFDSAQTTLSLSQLFELGGKREGRLAAADARAARLVTEQSLRQLDVVTEIARAFVETLAQQARVATAEAAVRLAQRQRATVDERVRAGASPPAERSRAVVALAETGLLLEDARHVLATSRFALAAAMGLDRPDFTQIAGDLFAQPPSVQFETLLAQLESTPDFLLFAADLRLRQAELALARSRRRADLQTTVGVRRYEQGDDAALVAGIAMPLFQASAAQPAVDAAHAEMSLVEQQRRAALLKARALLFTHHQEMEHARHVVSTLDSEILPELERALAQTEDGWRRGRYSLLEWTDVQRRLLDARNRRIDAAAEFQLHRIEIERLTGADLAQAGETR